MPLDTIELFRTWALDRILHFYFDLVDRLKSCSLPRACQASCSLAEKHRCDQLLLGGLSKTLLWSGYQSIFPTRSELSIYSVRDVVAKLRTTMLSSASSVRLNRLHESCSLEIKFNAFLHELEEKGVRLRIMAMVNLKNDLARNRKRFGV